MRARVEKVDVLGWNKSNICFCTLTSKIIIFIIWNNDLITILQVVKYFTHLTILIPYFGVTTELLFILGRYGFYGLMTSTNRTSFCISALFIWILRQGISINKWSIYFNGVNLPLWKFYLCNYIVSSFLLYSWNCE